jgi:hypothetical protein
MFKVIESSEEMLKEYLDIDGVQVEPNLWEKNIV